MDGRHACDGDLVRSPGRPKGPATQSSMAVARRQAPSVRLRDFVSPCGIRCLRPLRSLAFGCANDVVTKCNGQKAGTGYEIIFRAVSKTSSIMLAVSFPVFVFCRLG